MLSKEQKHSIHMGVYGHAPLIRTEMIALLDHYDALEREYKAAIVVVTAAKAVVDKLEYKHLIPALDEFIELGKALAQFDEVKG